MVYNETMFRLSGSLLNKRVMSLRTGGQVALTVGFIINPNNLKVEGLYCKDSFDRKKTVVLLYQDVRDIIDRGIIINDHGVLSDISDLIRLKDIMELNFGLTNKPVITSTGKKIGKISDWAVETDTFYIQKLYVSQPLIKNLSGGSLSVDRNQIIEITDRKIIIKDPLQSIQFQNAKSPITSPAFPAG